MPPDRTDSGQGRDALDAAMDVLVRSNWICDHTVGDEHEQAKAQLTAARAAVRKAAREMGEEAEVICLWSYTVANLPEATSFQSGDRVRVVKVGTTEDSHGSVCYWRSRDGEPIENCEKLYTDCGHRYDNGVCKFCPFCGKKVGE